MPVTAPASARDFIELVKQCGVLSPERLNALPDPDDLPPEAGKAAAVLVQKGFLTRFQASQMLAGRHKGFRIGQYIIQDLLGRGGMGAVYLAQHVDLHRKVAIKVLTPGKGDDQRLAVERFLREARAVAALDHPNIVRIFDVARQNDVPYLVMEYVEGETLQQTLDRERRLPHGIAAEYIAQAAAGLQHAHEKGFIHRDIKPGNLIRDRSGVVKILDMGLARSADDTDKLTEQFDEGAVVGTADFISPEQAINSPNVDARADIYSLGATLYTLVVGKTPFDGNTTQKLMQHQLKEAPPLSEVNLAVPQELSDVVGKMLAKKPEDRYQTAAEVIAALAPWAADSARVLAGVSRTKLGGGDSQAALQERLSLNSHRMSKKLNRKKVDSDPDSSVDPSAAGKPTKALTSSETTRDRPQPVAEAADPSPRKRNLIIAGAGVAVLVAVVGGWLAFGRDKAPETAKGVTPPPEQVPQQPVTPPPQGTNPKPPQPKPPEPKPPEPRPPEGPKPAEQARFATDFAGMKSFVVRSGLTVDPNDANKKTYQLISQTGAGTLPTGWVARCYNKDSEMEVFADTVEGRPVLGIRGARGPGSAMLFTPRFDSPSGVVRLRIEYAASVRANGFMVRFKADDQRGAWDVQRLAVGGDAWRTEELLVDLKGASGGFFEFHNTDPSPAASVRFRSVSVVEPSPVSQDRIAFKLDAYDLPGFRNAKTGQKKTSGEDEPKIRGVYFGGWKPESESEWVCAPVAGAKAIGITNVSDVISAQIGIELESARGVGATFTPGQLVRMRVTYRTSGKGRGSIYFQNADDHKVPDRASLPNSNSEWRTVELVTQRKNNPLRCLVDTSEKGAGNTLFVRTVTVSAAGDPRSVAVAPQTPTPAPAPKTNPALDPATWAEGAILYSLDVAKIPAFRNQKEKGMRLGGDAEQLPAGIGCQCWKDGAIAEFRRTEIDGVPALGVTNLNDEKSGQYYLSFEGGLKLTLQPGKAYRVKIGYRTANDAAGSATVNVAPGYKGLATTKLGPGASDWKTANVSFIRPPAEDKVEVRMGIDNMTVGEGNTLWVRSVELVELVKPK
jgi:eukaryotic-like serine/threonine-protein kinase